MKGNIRLTQILECGLYKFTLSYNVIQYDFHIHIHDSDFQD